jgi:hypothetical protein
LLSFPNDLTWYIFEELHNKQFTAREEKENPGKDGKTE